MRSRPGRPDRHQKCTGPERHRVTPLSTTGRYSTDPGHDRPDAGRFSHASETMSAYVAGFAAGTDGDRPGIPDPVRPGPDDRPGTTGSAPIPGTARGSRSDGTDRRPRMALGRTSLGRTGLGSPGDDIRPRSPGRGPRGGPGHTGTGGRTGPGVFRRPGRGARSGLGGTDGHRDAATTHDVRAGTGVGGEGRRGRDGRGSGHRGHRGTRKSPLPDVMPALGPAQRKDIPEPAVPAPTLAAERRPVPLATGDRASAIATPAVGMGAATTGPSVPAMGMPAAAASPSVRPP